MIQQLIESNYDLKVSDITLLDRHFGTEIYRIKTNAGRYILKILPRYAGNANNEGLVTAYLFAHGLKVARLLKTKDGNYSVTTPENQLTVQEYIAGDTLPINTAPQWFMEQSAAFLGKTNRLLQNYGKLPLRFGKDFFSPGTVIEKKQQYIDALTQAKKSQKGSLIPIWEEQIQHLDRISKFHIDTEKMTYVNSHGDYHIGQMIVKEQDITVIDWTSACCLPVCLEVITSYVFASPACCDGVVDAEGLNKYIQTYTKHFPLTEYDINAMPYVLYFWHCVCNYRPDELESLAPNYQPIAKLINQLLRWLYGHVEKLSETLVIQ